MASLLVRSLAHSLLSLAVVTLACSDDGLTGATGTGDGATTGRATTTATDTAAADPSNAGGDSESAEPPELTSSTGMLDEAGSTTGSGNEDSADTRGSTGRGTGGSSDGTGAPPATTTGGPGNVVYSAIAVPGGLDRIRINKADLDNDRCTWVILVAPPTADMYPGMTIPAGWSVESIAINDVAVSCDAGNPAMFGSESALDANGSITFGMLGGGGLYPCMVDIDALFDFQGILPGIPPMDDMLAVDIPVMGC